MNVTTTSPRFEPWYGAYLLVGAVVSGFFPILLPLRVAQVGDASHIGLVMAALSLGQLSAPLWGYLADTFQAHRWLFAFGLTLLALGLTSFSLLTNPYLLSGLALLLGLGVAAVTTVANLYVVERFPKDTWSTKLGAMQSVYGIGQVGGLVVAGVLSLAHLGLAFGVAAVVAALGLCFIPLLPNITTAKQVALPPRTHEPLYASLGHFRLADLVRAFRHLGTTHLGIKPSPFARFLLVWLLANAGATFVFALYPLLMQKVYGVSPSVSAGVYACGVALSLGLYGGVGRLIQQRGPLTGLRRGLVVRSLAFAGMVAVGLMTTNLKLWLAPTLFVVTVLAWAFLSVSGSTLAGASSLPEG
jgi:MFS family permease